MLRRHLFGLFPTGYGSSRTWIYVIGIPGGVKFGMTWKPRDRMVEHWRGFKEQIEWAHLGPSYPDRREARMAEATACLFAGARGQREGITERFTGLTRRQAIECLRAVDVPLTGTRGAPVRPAAATPEAEPAKAA